MCGIAGYSIGTGVIPHTKALILAKDALAHRGPDDWGLFTEALHGIGLVHTRLSIQDLSLLGHQPMFNESGEIGIVFNGEIYNFRELRDELVEKGYIFRGCSDTEVLLNLYLAYRHEPDGIPSFLRRLNGIFAFAIWDGNQKGLLLARDPFGVKPLYYYTTQEFFAFASEIKALLPFLNSFSEHDSFMKKLDLSAIDRYLTYLWCPGEQTPMELVKKILPGQALWVKRGIIENQLTWYQLPAFRMNAKQLYIHQTMTMANAVRGTEHYLRQAVQRQMVADVPLGAFLSGGLDSSSVVAFARELNPTIRCFTIHMEDTEKEGMGEDLPYARRVAKHLNVPLEIIHVNPLEMAAHLPDMVAQLDEPLADPAGLNVLYICRSASAQGIKVLLSGTGGDDLFTGYRRHQVMMVEKLWGWMPEWILDWLGSGSNWLNTVNPLSRRLRKLFRNASLKGDDRLVDYFRWINRKDLISLYTNEFRAILSKSRSEDPMLKFIANLPPNTEPLERLLTLEQRFFLADHNLTYTDKMSMAAGVEVRVPFLDLELVDFVAQIPTNLKQRGTKSKWVLKKTMEPHLPHDVIYRPKSGFGAPLRRWLRVELRDWLFDILSSKRLEHRGLFDPLAVKQLIKDNYEGRIDAAYTLLSLVCIELWCQKFID